MQDHPSQHTINSDQADLPSCPKLGLRDSLSIIKAFISGRMDVWIDDFYPRFGDHFFVPSLNFYVLNRPTLIYELLVKQPNNASKGKFITENFTSCLSKGLLSNEGEEWAFTRRLLTKEFSKGSISKNRNGFSLITGHHVKGWQTKSVNKSPLDITQAAFKLAFETISVFLFKRNAEHYFDEVHNSLEAMRKAAQLRVLGPLRHLPMWFPLPLLMKARQGRSRMHEIVRELAKQYQAGMTDQQLTATLSNQIMDRISAEVAAGTKTNDWADGELVILYLAGHETTATGIGWMSYAVATRPELQELLYDEGKNVNFESLEDPAEWDKLPLHQQVVEESLRFYPPVPGIGRSYPFDIELSSTVIPGNATIAMMPTAVHRHPEFWPRANDFLPERFSEQNRKNIQQGSYIPFGLGPRRCIGAEMATMQMTIVLAHMIRNFRLQAKNRNPIHILNSFTSQPSEKIELILEPR